MRSVWTGFLCIWWHISMTSWQIRTCALTQLAHDQHTVNNHINHIPNTSLISKHRTPNSLPSTTTRKCRTFWGNTTQNTSKQEHIQVRGGKHFSTHTDQCGTTHQSLVNISGSFGKVLHHDFISLHKSAQFFGLTRSHVYFYVFILKKSLLVFNAK